MLPMEMQKKLAIRYGDGMLKEAFEQRVAKAFAVEFAEERQEYAAVVMVDIFRFSAVVCQMSATQVREFLNGYYERVMPELFRYGGMIDRVAGDGVLAVFSPFFTGATDEDANRSALSAGEAIVRKVAGTAYSSKAAISGGPLEFCKAGVSGIYEECTVIGGAITRTYRIEEIATENQVVVEQTPGFRAIVEAQLSARSRLPERSLALIGPPVWDVARETVDLRGVGSTELYVQRLNR